MWHGFATALVTGASSGIGEQFARILARQNVNLILTARSQDRLAALATELLSAGAPRIEVIAIDLSCETAAAALWDEINSRQLMPDLLINNAGFGLGGHFSELSIDRQLDMIRLNISASVQLTHCFLQYAVTTGKGGVIMVASMAGFIPMPGMAIYSATKAFLANFTEGLRQEVAPRGIRVMSVLPGIVPTGFQQTAGVDIARNLRFSALTAEQVAAEGLAAFAAGHPRWVPGMINRLIFRLLPIVPQRLLAWLASRNMAFKDTQ